MNEPGAAFTVGEWRVEPALNQISRDGMATTLQPKVMRLLETLATSPGVAIDRQVIIDQLWPGQVVTDSSLYQAVANLRKALGDTAPDRAYVESVSSRGYRLIAPVRKAPDSLNPGERRPGNLFPTVLFFIAVAGVLIVVAVSLFSSVKTTSDNTPVTGVEDLNRLMVMPFTAVGSDTDRTIIASLQEALLTHLVRVGNVQIIEGNGDTSASNADGFIHGSVQSEGRSLRVYLRLTRATDQAVLWGEQFESPAGALFKLQDRVARGLLAAIGHRGQEQVFHAESVEAGAFADYLEGRVLWAERSESSLNRAEKIFLSVIERAPRFAQAYVGLCDTYFFSSVYQNRTLSEALSACHPLLERALVLHPDLGEALATKALFIAQQGDDETANALFEKAIQNAPNYAFARMWYGNHLRRQGALTEAQVQHELAIELAPFSPIVRRNLAYVLLNQGQVPAARRAYTDALELEPDYSFRAVNELDFFTLTVERAVNFLRWTQEHPDHYGQDPDAQLSNAMVQLALNDVTAATKIVDEAAAHPHVDASYLLYARGVIALAQSDYATAQQWFYERRNWVDANSTSFSPTLARCAQAEILKPLGIWPKKPSSPATGLP